MMINNQGLTNPFLPLPDELHLSILHFVAFKDLLSVIQVNKKAYSLGTDFTFLQEYMGRISPFSVGATGAIGKIINLLETFKGVMFSFKGQLPSLFTPYLRGDVPYVAYSKGVESSSKIQHICLEENGLTYFSSAPKIETFLCNGPWVGWRSKKNIEFSNFSRSSPYQVGTRLRSEHSKVSFLGTFIFIASHVDQHYDFALWDLHQEAPFFTKIFLTESFFQKAILLETKLILFFDDSLFCLHLATGNLLFSHHFDQGVSSFISATGWGSRLFFSYANRGIEYIDLEQTPVSFMGIGENFTYFCRAQSEHWLVTQEYSVENQKDKEFKILDVSLMEQHCSLLSSATSQDTIEQVLILEDCVIATFLRGGLQFWALPSQSTQSPISPHLFFKRHAQPDLEPRISFSNLGENNYAWGFEEGTTLFLYSQKKKQKAKDPDSKEPSSKRIKLGSD